MTTQEDIREAIRNAQTLLQSLATVDLEAAPAVAIAIADKCAQQVQSLVMNIDANRHEVMAREISRTLSVRPTPTNFRKVGTR